MALALLSLLAAAWVWLQPYEWKPDSPDGTKIQSAQLTRDHSYFWLDLRLDPGQLHGLPHPLELTRTDASTDTPTIKPVQVDFEGQGLAPGANPEATLQNLRSISLRFWLEKAQLEHPLTLVAGTAHLTVRSRSGPPPLADGDRRTFRSHHW